MKSPKQQLADQRRDETVAYLWSCYRQGPRQRRTPQPPRRTLHAAGAAHRAGITSAAIQLREARNRHRRRPAASDACGSCRTTTARATSAAGRARLHPPEDARSPPPGIAATADASPNVADCETDWPEIEAQLVRPDEPGSDVRFAELAAALPARDAAALWLRFYRHSVAPTDRRGSRRDQSHRDPADSRRDRHAAGAGGGKRAVVST